MIVAELLASLGVEVDKASLSKADSALTGVARNATKILGGIAAIFGGASFVGFTNALINIAGELDDTRKRLGISATALQQWRYVAEQTGASAESISSAFKFVSKNAYDAANGLKEPGDAFRTLGVRVTEADGSLRNNEVLLQETLTALSAIPDTATRTALALKVMGRGASELLPLIADGPEALAKLRAEFDALGGGYSEEFVASGEALGDAIVGLKQGAIALKSAFGVVLFPVIARVVDVATKLTMWFNRITKGTRFVKMGLAVMTAGFVAWGAAALWAARQAIAGWLAAAAPFLLVGVALAALALLLDDIAALLTGGKSLIGKYLDEWFGVGTVDGLVRSWSAGVTILSNAVDSLIGNLSGWEIALIAITGPLGILYLVLKNIESVMSAIGDLGEWVFSGVRRTINKVTEGLTSGTFGDRQDVVSRMGSLRTFKKGTALESQGEGLSLAPDSPVSAMERVNRDGSAFFDFAANRGVALPDAVHPAFRPGTVDAPAGAGATTVDASTHAPITVNGATDPRETAREIRRELDARDAAQAERVKRALVNRPVGGT